MMMMMKRLVISVITAFGPFQHQNFCWSSDRHFIGGMNNLVDPLAHPCAVAMM